MNVAVIIVAYNAEKRIKDLLDSLRAQTYPGDKFKVFIADNASHDNTLKIIKSYYPEAEIIENSENYGFAKGNNIGIKKAIGQGYEGIVLLNDDTIVDSLWLEELVKKVQSDKNIGSAQSLVILYSKKEKINSTGGVMHYLGFGYCNDYQSEISRITLPDEIAYCGGVSVIYKTSVLKIIGLFDDDFFMYHEDYDLGWKLRLAGYISVLCPKSICYHKYEFSKSIKKYYWMERNRYITVFSNYKILTILLILPALIFMETGLFVFSIFRGFWKEKLKVYAYFFKLSSWSHISGRRKQINKFRKIKDRSLFKVLNGKILFQEINNPILTYIANPIFNLYLKLIKLLIFW